MDVLLISPPWIIRKGSFWKGLIANTPSIGLGYLAACLEERGVTVEIIDASARGITLADVRREIEQRAGVAWIGISTTSYQYRMACEVARAAKQASPSSRVVMGGVHPTLFPDEVLQNRQVDYVVRHEGELTLPELVQGAAPEGIAGLSYRRDGTVVHNSDRPWIENLDDVPLPAFHRMPMDKSRLSLSIARRTPAMMLIGSRGCPFKCNFCNTTVMGTKYRFRSAENIVSEIRVLMQRFGIREIHFQDDSFTLNRDRVMRLCDIIIQENIDISWLCMTHVAAVDQDMLHRMKAAGCHQICFGVESGNQGILRNLNKNTTLDQIRAVVPLMKRAGIDARGSIMVGCPGETEETLERTLAFVKEIDLDLITVTIFTPIPGSKIHEWAKTHNLLLTEDWTEYTGGSAVMRLPGLSPEAVRRWHLRMYRRFYLRPKFIARQLRKIRSAADIMVHLKMFAKVAHR